MCPQTLFQGSGDETKIIIPRYNNATQKHPGCKKVRGLSEANRYVRPKTLISVEAKKLLSKNLFHYLNDIQ